MSDPNDKDRVARTSRGDQVAMPTRTDGPTCFFCGAAESPTGDCTARCESSRMVRVKREG